MDQQHRATLCALNDALSLDSYKPAIFIDSRFLIISSSDVLGEEDCGPSRGEVAGSGVKGETAAILC